MSVLRGCRVMFVLMRGLFVVLNYNFFATNAQFAPHLTRINTNKLRFSPLSTNFAIKKSTKTQHHGYIKKRICKEAA